MMETIKRQKFQRHSSPPVFMRQATALMLPSPGCAGILGRAFLDCFPAVEFVFHRSFVPPSVSASSSSDASTAVDLSSEGPAAAPDAKMQEERLSQGHLLGSHEAAGSREEGKGDVVDAGVASSANRIAPDGQPELRLHSEFDWRAAVVAGGLRRVPVVLLGGTGLWGLRLRVDGEGGRTAIMPALIDTGAPVSVLNAAAAELLGLGTPPPPPPPPPASPKAGGLFGRLLSGLTAQQKQPTAGAGGGLVAAASDVRFSVRAWLDVDAAYESEAAADTSGRKNSSGAAAQGPDDESNVLSAISLDEQGGEVVDFGFVRPMMGDMPGFATLGIGAGEPAAILGMDALRRRSSVALCGRDKVFLL